jgi:hypothetical protein
MTMLPPAKRRYDEPRPLGPSRRRLTDEQERRRHLLRACINGCDPRMSDAEFARRKLHRHPSAVKKWLHGERPIPDVVLDALEAKLPYQKRKARESAREPFQNYTRELLPMPANAAPPVAMRIVNEPSPPRHDAPVGSLPGPPFTEHYAADYWLCACSKPDRYRTWKKMAVAVCEECGYVRPPAAGAMQTSGPTSTPPSRSPAISRTAPRRTDGSE